MPLTPTLFSTLFSPDLRPALRPRWVGLLADAAVVAGATVALFAVVGIVHLFLLLALASIFG